MTEKPDKDKKRLTIYRYIILLLVVAVFILYFAFGSNSATNETMVKEKINRRV